MLFLSWIALVTTGAGQRGRSFARDHSQVALAMVALAAWAAISAVWAEIPSAALSGASSWALNLALFPIVYTAVRRPAHVHWIFSLFIFGALLSVAIGLATGTTGSTDARLAGDGLNANELGQLLAVAVILAGGLGASRDLSGPARALAFGAAGVAVIALLMTLSRGALTGLGVGLLLTPFVAGRGRRVAAVALVVLAAGCAVSYLTVLAPRSSVEFIFRSDSTGSGRTDIWRVGLRMVEAHPVRGVGANNYANSTVHYLLEPGQIKRSDYIVDTPKVAHNLYLQVQAELGIVGLALFLALVAFSVSQMFRAAHDFARRGDRSMEILCRALILGILGLLASGFFGSAIYSKQLWLLLALGPALRLMAREAPPRVAQRRGMPAVAAPATAEQRVPVTSR
jgi:O-antigen ligase